MKVCFCFWVITAVQLQEKRCSLSTDTRISEVSSSKDAKMWACFHVSKCMQSSIYTSVLEFLIPESVLVAAAEGPKVRPSRDTPFWAKPRHHFLSCSVSAHQSYRVHTYDAVTQEDKRILSQSSTNPCDCLSGKSCESIFGYICFCAFCAQVLKWLGSGEGERSILFSVRSPCVCAEVTSGSTEGWGQSPGGSSLWLEDWSSPRSQPWGRGRGLECKWTTSGQQSIQSYIHNGTSTETFKKGAWRTSGLVNTSTLEGWPIPTPWGQKTLHLGPSGPSPMYLLIWPFIWTLSHPL